jgi:hypothetical protein
VLRTPKKRESLPDVLDRRELVRLLDATERGDVWKRKHDGKRERDRLLLARLRSDSWNGFRGADS